MNGIICINKPQGFTSFDVVAKMRGIAKQKKIGHTGTLDPLATGVLPLMFGNATRACDIIPDKTKAYEAGFKLGITTDTQDITGSIISQVESFSVMQERVCEVFEGFRGITQQIPPMYSAVSVNGKRLYDLARKGIEVERKPRQINVTALEVLCFDGINGKVKIECSEGTYIRTIIHDAGAKFGTGAVMTSLERTRACSFELSDCITLEEAESLSKNGFLESRLISVDKLFYQYPALYFTEEQERLFTNGVRLDAARVEHSGEGIYRAYGKNFLAIAEVAGGEVINKKGFYGGNQKEKSANT